MDCKLHRNEEEPTTLRVHVTKDESMSGPVNIGGDVCARAISRPVNAEVREKAIIEEIRYCPVQTCKRGGRVCVSVIIEEARCCPAQTCECRCVCVCVRER